MVVRSTKAPKPGEKLKKCAFCGRYKSPSEFYTRKKGVSAGQRTANCIGCNTDAARYALCKRRYLKGTLEEFIEDLYSRIEMAERVKLEMANEQRNQRALAIGLKVLADQEKQAK